MSEEEKKAIIHLKSDYISLQLCYDYTKQGLRDLGKNIGTILNLIEKQQKENIKLKQEQAKRSWIHVKENGEVEPLLYISKDKIRKKIEELENGEQCYYEFSTVDLVDLLKILLEEE